MYSNEKGNKSQKSETLAVVLAFSMPFLNCVRSSFKNIVRNAVTSALKWN